MTCHEEEILDSLKTNVLDEKRSLLCQNLTPKAHYPYLRSKHILSEDDEEEIELQQLRKQKVHKFLDLLVRKGRHGFDELVKSLIQERTQLFLAEELNKAFEEKQKRLYALFHSDDSPVRGELQKKQKGEPSNNNPRLILDSTRLSGSHVENTRNSFPAVEPFRNSSSDLGVDIENLPKPVMQKKSTTKEEKDKDGCEHSVIEANEKTFTVDFEKTTESKA